MAAGVAGAHLDPKTLQAGVHVADKRLWEAGQHGRASLEQHDPRLVRADAAEITGQGIARQGADRTGELDAAGAAADNDEGEQALYLVGIGPALRLLESVQQPEAQRLGVLEAFQPERMLGPVVMPEPANPAPITTTFGRDPGKELRYLPTGSQWRPSRANNASARDGPSLPAA